MACLWSDRCLRRPCCSRAGTTSGQLQGYCRGPLRDARLQAHGLCLVAHCEALLQCCTCYWSQGRALSPAQDTKANTRKATPCELLERICCWTGTPGARQGILVELRPRTSDKGYLPSSAFEPLGRRNPGSARGSHAALPCGETLCLLVRQVSASYHTATRCKC